ncbi:Hypothetical protein Bdt_2893 [Bdellovibrio bacteriovorus str. Tiberius]|uniref:Uncharacterized protein n=1 Tax=Bdellovibrio bacteriovorus str. Tiberius TaxID=1069642 RepID=K7YY21_BDEBC|nr:Hypothetical protein Bdt_2893 [Bdellovibrio bacteriovorus str. Tiberius]
MMLDSVPAKLVKFQKQSVKQADPLKNLLNL